MNTLPPNYVRVIKGDLRRGYSLRETAIRRGVSKTTVSKIYRSWEEICYCLCGAEITHQGWCDFRFLRSQKRQDFMAEWHRKTDDMNPPCQCGCGQEVSRPGNKFLLGHSSGKRLSLEHVEAAIILQKHGWSQVAIGRVFGVSGTAICLATINTGNSLSKLGARAISIHARKPIGAKELAQWDAIKKQRKDIATGRRLIRAVRQVAKRGNDGERSEAGLA